MDWQSSYLFRSNEYANEGIYLVRLQMELKHFDQGMVFSPTLIKESRKFLLSLGLMA